MPEIAIADHSQKTKLDNFFSRRGLWLIILFYIPTVVISVMNRFDRINTDGVAYQLFARHLARGEFWQSVEASFSPLFIWLIAPFMASGISGPLAARIILAGAGLGVIVASWFLARSLKIGPVFRFLSVFLIAAGLSTWVTDKITPDVLLLFLLLTYFTCTLKNDLLTSRLTPFLAGIFAGLAFLSKAFALPYFFVHFTIILALAAFFFRPPQVWKRLVISWMLGVIGFTAIATPWIAVMSNKYHHLTISTVGSITHALIGPPDRERYRPMMRGLWEPKPGQLNVWEEASMLPYPYWSPFESLEYFKYQLWLTYQNTLAIFQQILRYDFFGLMALAVLILPLLALVRFPAPFVYWWIWLSSVIYLGGYTLVMEDRVIRYFLPAVVLLLLGWFYFADRIRQVLEKSQAASESSWRRRLFVAGLAAIIFLSFGYQIFRDLRYDLFYSKPVYLYSTLAQDLSKIYPSSRVAANDWSQGLFVSSFLTSGVKFLGKPAAADSEEIFSELQKYNVDTFLVFGNSGLAASFSKSKQWRLIKHYPAGYFSGVKSEYDVFAKEDVLK